MALLKAHTVARLAILLNCCMHFICRRPAVQWHCLVLKEKSQNVMGLICTWDGHRHVCATLSILRFSSRSSSTQVFTSETVLCSHRAPGYNTFPDTQHMFYSNESTSFHPFYVSTLLWSPSNPSSWRLELCPETGHQVKVRWAAWYSLIPLPGTWRKTPRMQYLAVFKPHTSICCNSIR